MRELLSAQKIPTALDKRDELLNLLPRRVIWLESWFASIAKAEVAELLFAFGGS
jgi:hypothetical protein